MEPNSCTGCRVRGAQRGRRAQTALAREGVGNCLTYECFEQELMFRIPRLNQIGPFKKVRCVRLLVLGSFLVEVLGPSTLVLELLSNSFSPCMYRISS